MNTPLEDEVHDALHRRADPLQRAPFTVGDVRTRARRIQRRRTMAAGAAVAAVIAIAVPFGVSMVGDPRSSEIPPATQTPTPTPTPAPSVKRTVRIDPRSAEVVDSTTVPLVDADAPSVITPDGTVTLPSTFSTITPYLDGWVGVMVMDGLGVVQFLNADLDVTDGGVPTGGLVVSPDGTRIAWSEYDGTRWRVMVADPTGGVERVDTTFPPAPRENFVVPVGFVSEDEVAVRAYDDSLTTPTYVAGGGAPVEVPGLQQAESASAAAGVVAGLTESRPDGSCSGIVDATTRTGELLWETCDYRLGSFSPDGQYVVGTSTQGAVGSSTLAVLDTTTHEPIVDFEVAGARQQVASIWSQMAWDGDEHLVVRVEVGEDQFIVRLGLDGTVQRVDVDTSGAGVGVAEIR